MSSFLQELAVAWHHGKPSGIYSVCSAHEWILEAAIEQAQEERSHLLIEATSNQVNHLGGYTGMRPADFRQRVLDIARSRSFDESRLILGGDHLGPNPWQNQPADNAMEQAVLMVQEYVSAGFQKIHLDASMPCAGDGEVLDGETIARRAATLCAAAEAAAGSEKPVYVIGTEVPTPGGATESLHELAVTSKQAAVETLATHKRVFAEAGLEHVWPRVIALVVQPGVEFNHDSVVNYEPAQAEHLAALLRDEPGLVYEAHSTDYQRPESYRNLVQDGFAILKVGPALTFAMREALTNLARIEAELVDQSRRSSLPEVLEHVMSGDKRYWEHHYSGNAQSLRLQRIYSYSDRVRYYWHYPQVRAAVDTLMSNLRSIEIPETLISNFLPDQYSAIRTGQIPTNAHAMIIHRIRQVLQLYADACRPEITAAA